MRNTSLVIVVGRYEKDTSAVIVVGRNKRNASLVIVVGGNKRNASLVIVVGRNKRNASLVIVVGRNGTDALLVIVVGRNLREASFVIGMGRNNRDTMPHEIAFMKLDCFSVVFCKSHLQAIEERIRVLERFQDNSVDAILGNCTNGELEEFALLYGRNSRTGSPAQSCSHGEQARDGWLFSALSSH